MQTPFKVNKCFCVDLPKWSEYHLTNHHVVSSSECSLTGTGQTLQAQSERVSQQEHPLMRYCLHAQLLLLLLLLEL